MALLSFLAGEGFALNDLAGSGLGLYGLGGYSTSVPVGSYQDNTYITNANGNATDAVKVDNVKWSDPASGILAGNDNRLLTAIPNYLSTLNVRFTNSTAVKVQNAQLRIFDRSDINNAPSGVVAKVALIVHPQTTSSPPGSGSTTWATLGGSGSVLNMSDFAAATSPGMSGLSPNGANTTDLTHDWYFALSAMPTQIGSVFFAAYFSLEFL